MCVSIVALRNRAEALLASRVPDLNLDRFVVNGQGLHFEIDSDCIMNVFEEAALDEAQQK